MPEPPWADLSELLLSGGIIPFLGAGASSYNRNQPNGAPPGGGQFAEEIADRAGLSVDNINCQIPCGPTKCGRAIFDLARVASYYQNCTATRLLLDQLIKGKICSRSFSPSPLHKLLAQVASRKHLFVITTNYDDLLERAFDELGVPYDVVATSADELSYEDSPETEAPEFAGAVWSRRSEASTFERKLPNDVIVDLEKRSFVYKIHGSVGDDKTWGGGFLIAEEDYARFLGRMHRGGIIPDSVLATMRQKKRIMVGAATRTVPAYSLLFLGYGMNDWNLRVLLQELKVGTYGIGEERHYAFLRGPSDIDRSLLEKRGITTYDCDLSRFVDELNRRWAPVGGEPIVQ